MLQRTDARSDREEFVRLTEPLRRELLAHCYRMLGSVRDAEGIVQETYLRASRSHGSFGDRSSLHAWLYRTAADACITALQRRGQRPVGRDLQAASAVESKAQPDPSSSSPGPVSWRLERNLRQVTFARRRELSVYADTTSAPPSAAHAHPAWTLLVPVGGGSVTVAAGDGVGAHHHGVLLAPQLPYRSQTDGPHVALYLNVWTAPRPRDMRRRVLSGRSTSRLVDALQLDDGVDTSAAVDEAGRSVGRLRVGDARLAAVLESLPGAGRLDTLAADVGLSPSRLRALALDAVGVPLTQLRLWARLGRAIALLPYGPTVTAAVSAGFADQPHLTRVARRFLGRTPGELSLHALQVAHHSGRPAQN